MGFQGIGNLSQDWGTRTLKELNGHDTAGFEAIITQDTISGDGASLGTSTGYSQDNRRDPYTHLFVLDTHGLANRGAGAPLRLKASCLKHG